MKFRSQDTASRRTVKLWLFVWAVLTYITHNKAFGLCLYNTGLFCGRARNVGMWLPARLVGRVECPRPRGSQLFPCLHLLPSTLWHLKRVLFHAARSCCSPCCICHCHTPSPGCRAGFVHCGPARMRLLKRQTWGRPELGYMCTTASQSVLTGWEYRSVWAKGSSLFAFPCTSDWVTSVE